MPIEKPKSQDSGEANFVDLVEGKYDKPATNQEAVEGTVTQEILEGNVENLQSNIGKIDEIPKSVLESTEGQVETQSLRSKISEKIKGMGNTIVEKLAKLDDWKTKDNFVKYAGAAGLSMMIGPALIQYARSQYPEVGVILDSAPDALQQIIHFDAWAHIANMFTDNFVESIWKGGSIEAGNFLADISSGRIDPSSLSADQMEMLRGSIGDTADLIKGLADKGNVEKAEYFARGSSTIGAGLKGVFGNMPLFAYAAGATYWLSGKIGKLASNKLEENN